MAAVPPYRERDLALCPSSISMIFGSEMIASRIGPRGRIFIFGFLSAMAPLSIDIYLPALPMLRQALAADEGQTLLTLSAFIVGFGGGQLVLGPLSDRFGRKRP